MTIIEFLWLLAIGPWWSSIILLDEELLQPLLLTMISGPIRCVWLRLWLCIFAEIWCGYECDITSTPCDPRLFVDLLPTLLRPFCWCCFKLLSYMFDNDELVLDLVAELFVDELFEVTIEENDEFWNRSSCWSIDEKLSLISKLLFELSFITDCIWLFYVLTFLSFTLEIYHRLLILLIFIEFILEEQNYSLLMKINIL